MNGRLAGRVVALIGQGSALDRALAIACAEAGADLALATVEPTQEQEFAMNSIANEAWAIGRDQFVVLLDASEPADVLAFAEQVADRYGRCDALVAAHHLASKAPLDELSPDEWEAAIRVNLTAPFLAAHAFGLVMDRLGEGVTILVSPLVEGADAAYRAARAGLEALAGAMNESWASRGVVAHALAVGEDPAAAVARAVDLVAGGAGSTRP